jgi:hypothetical protein
MNGLIGLGILLLMLWLVGFIVFKVAGFLIHLLILVAVVMLIAGFVRRVAGRRTGV